jgi:hypothetical protein
MMTDRDGRDDGLPKPTGSSGKKPPPEKTTENMSRASARSNWAMTPEIQNKIGQQLRAVYSDIVDQGVPDRFAKLIDQLEGQTKNKNTDQLDGQAKTENNEPK